MKIEKTIYKNVEPGGRLPEDMGAIMTVGCVRMGLNERDMPYITINTPINEQGEVEVISVRMSKEEYTNLLIKGNVDENFERKNKN